MYKSTFLNNVLTILATMLYILLNTELYLLKNIKKIYFFSLKK